MRAQRRPVRPLAGVVADMAIIQNRPGVRTPSLISTGGSFGLIDNPLDGLGRGLQSAIDQRDDRKRALAANDKRDFMQERDRADQAEAARLSSQFRLEQGGVLDDRAMGYTGDAPGFAVDEIERYDTARSAFLEKVPEHLRDRLDAVLGGGARTAHGLAADNIERARTSERALRAAGETADASAQAVVTDPGALDIALEGVADAALGLPPALQGEWVAEQNERVALAWGGAMLRDNPGALADAIERGDIDDIVSAENAGRLLNAANAETERRARQAQADAARAEAAAARAQRDTFQRMRVEFAQGDLTRTDIDAALAEGEIDIDSWANLAVAAQSAQEAADAAAAERDLLLGGPVLDPSNAAHRDAVDGAWRDFLADGDAQAEFTANPGAFTADLVAMTQNYGVVPPSGVTALRALAASGDDNQQAGALDAIAAISNVREVAASTAFTANLVADAALYQSVASNGLAPAQALARVRTAREARGNTPQAVLMSQADAVLADMDVPAMLEQHFDAIPIPFVGRPDLGSESNRAAATLQFRQLYRTHFAEHGDAVAAGEQAMAVMGRSWGSSRVTGDDVFMAYPPERFYSVPGQDNQWMRDQLGAAVGEIADGEVRDVRLISDAQTAREAQGGLPPSYMVSYADDEGRLFGAPGRWQFDPSAAQGAAARENREALEAATAAREAGLADLPFRELDMMRYQRDTTRYGADHAADLDAAIAARENELGAEAISNWRARRAHEARVDGGL